METQLTVAPLPRLTNNTGVPLSVAVWLADDHYEYFDDPRYVSATTLIKSPRQIILSKRVQRVPGSTMDVTDVMSAKFGQAIHNDIEFSWTNQAHRDRALDRLGYPATVRDRIVVNPDPKNLPKRCIPIYMERRAWRTVGNHIVGGKFDFCGQGNLDDFKSTGVYTFQKNTSDWKYRLQGSIYKWLNPLIITGDYINIQFIFTDWSARKAKTEASKNYPPARMLQHKVPLMTPQETENWIYEKLHTLDELESVEEGQLPLCQQRDLWQDATIYKYFSNPNSTGRSSKNFTNNVDAQTWLTDKGKGKVVPVHAPVRACNYCDGRPLCKQADALVAAGKLKPI